MRILVVGHGKMGRLIASLAPECGCDVTGIVDPSGGATFRHVDEVPSGAADVAIDFTVPDAVVPNVSTLAARGLSIVLGTTGWQQHEHALRGVVEAARVGIVAAPNFSTGVLLFDAIVAEAARLLTPHGAFEAWMHEQHHAKKQDAPSGTALMLQRALERGGYTRPLEITATRAGYIPGTHTVGFDGPAESITLTHTARDRSAFARGALHAATWLQGRRGWYTMHDVLGLS